MKVDNYFEEIWKIHSTWGMGILYKNLIKTDTSEILLSDIPGPYFNIATPTVTNPTDLKLDKLLEEFKKLNVQPSVFLHEKHIQNGFEEYLIRNKFKFEGQDSWMGYSPNTHFESSVKSDVVEVTPKTFTDYDSVLGKVFQDFAGNKTYLQICEKTINGELTNNFPGLKSELYLIYYGNTPAAGAGMFYSKEENFAYLHDAGTQEEFRGKGYQSDLIKFRVNKALKLGINRIYSSVDHGGKSWSNSIKCGLNQLHTGSIFVSK